jgi:hypothetical protein
METLASDPRLSAAYLKSKHAAGLTYEQYLATDPAKAPNWRKIDDQLRLTDGQRTLVAGFTRRINVVVSSGIWCGDCVAQGPMIQAIARANPQAIDVKWLDRDVHMDLSQRIIINAGLRVPTVLFMAEDFEPVSILGDRTLTRYRAVAARQLGPSCPLPGAPIPAEELAATLQEWLDEFERVHLLLRLSARLREKHGD